MFRRLSCVHCVAVVWRACHCPRQPLLGSCTAYLSPPLHNLAAQRHLPPRPPPARPPMLPSALAEHCPHCRAALARVRSGAAGAAVAVGAAFLTLCAAWGRGVAPLSPASLALLCVLGAALAARSALEKLKQQFIFSDWRHADH